MKYIQVKVQFEQTFTYEFEDDEFVGSWVDEPTEQGMIDDTIDTLADRSNRYWNDADYTLTEIFP